MVTTSFSPQGFEQYGRECLKSYIKHWPCKILVWYEEKPDFEHELVEYRDLNELQSLNKFLERLESVPDSDGIINGRYNYNFDARKFCKKVFCQEASFDLDEKVFWLDADTVSFGDVPVAFLEDLVAEVPFSYLGRAKTYTETGFLGFNTKHKDFAEFRNRYQRAYTSGRIFSEKAWHDCIAFDIARGSIKGNDLNKDTPYQGLDHCWPHTVLNQFLIHKKGPVRKGLLDSAPET